MIDKELRGLETDLLFRASVLERSVLIEQALIEAIRALGVSRSREVIEAIEKLRARDRTLRWDRAHLSLFSRP